MRRPRNLWINFDDLRLKMIVKFTMPNWWLSDLSPLEVRRKGLPPYVWVHGVITELTDSYVIIKVKSKEYKDLGSMWCPRETLKKIKLCR